MSHVELVPYKSRPLVPEDTETICLPLLLALPDSSSLIAAMWCQALMRRKQWGTLPQFSYALNNATRNTSSSLFLRVSSSNVHSPLHSKIITTIKNSLWMLLKFLSHVEMLVENKPEISRAEGMHIHLGQLSSTQRAHWMLDVTCLPVDHPRAELLFLTFRILASSELSSTMLSRWSFAGRLKWIWALRIKAVSSLKTIIERLVRAS